MVFCHAYGCVCPAVARSACPSACLHKSTIQNNYKVRINNRRHRIYYSALLSNSKRVPPTHETNRSTRISLTKLQTKSKTVKSNYYFKNLQAYIDANVIWFEEVNFIDVNEDIDPAVNI